MSNDKKDKIQETTEEKTTPSVPNLEKQDANVNEEGLCITTQDGEMARPNSGDPCDDGR